MAGKELKICETSCQSSRDQTFDTIIDRDQKERTKPWPCNLIAKHILKIVKNAIFHTMK